MANVGLRCQVVVRVCVTGEVLVGEGEVKHVLSFPWISIWSTLLAYFSSMLMEIVAGMLAMELPVSLLHQLARAIGDLTILSVHESTHDCHQHFIWGATMAVVAMATVVPAQTILEGRTSSQLLPLSTNVFGRVRILAGVST